MNPQHEAIICPKHPACSWCLLCGGERTFWGCHGSLILHPSNSNQPPRQLLTACFYIILATFQFKIMQNPSQCSSTLNYPLTLQGKTKTRIKNRDTSYRSGFANLYRYKHETSPTCQKNNGHLCGKHLLIQKNEKQEHVPEAHNKTSLITNNGGVPIIVAHQPMVTTTTGPKTVTSKPSTKSCSAGSFFRRHRKPAPVGRWKKMLGLAPSQDFSGKYRLTFGIRKLKNIS